MCLFLYGQFCHGALKLDLSTLFTAFCYLNISLIDINMYTIYLIRVCCSQKLVFPPCSNDNVISRPILKTFPNLTAKNIETQSDKSVPSGRINAYASGVHRSREVVGHDRLSVKVASEFLKYLFKGWLLANKSWFCKFPLRVPRNMLHIVMLNYKCFTSMRYHYT